MTPNEVMKKHLYEPGMGGNMLLIVTYSRTVSFFSSRDYKAYVPALIIPQQPYTYGDEVSQNLGTTNSKDWVGPFAV